MKYFGHIKKMLVLIPAVLLLTACASKNNSPLAADVGFINTKDLPVSTAGINPIRLKAIQETALTLGARGALAWRAKNIDASLQSYASTLNHVFDFNQILLKHNVLPPVIVEANNDIHLANNNSIRLANKVYKIIKPARFVTTPPTWRTYLWLTFKKPNLPNQGMLPTNKAEAAVWNQYLKKGWKSGLIQANSIFNANVNRLRRDYMGMVLYKKMITQSMVSAPTVAKANMGVTGNGKEMRVNDVIMRITSHSSLQTNSNKWQPFLTKE